MSTTELTSGIGLETVAAKVASAAPSPMHCSPPGSRT
jgi:hypothetical protein